MGAAVKGERYDDLVKTKKSLLGLSPIIIRLSLTHVIGSVFPGHFQQVAPYFLIETILFGHINNKNSFSREITKFLIRT